MGAALSLTDASVVFLDRVAVARQPGPIGPRSIGKAFDGLATRLCRGLDLLAAPPDRAAGRDPYAAKRRDTAAVRRWRERMGTAEAQTLYRQRCGLAEVIHARMEQRRWRRFRLRGLRKVNTEGVWQALVHNVGRLLSLGRLVREG